MLVTARCWVGLLFRIVELVDNYQAVIPNTKLQRDAAAGGTGVALPSLPHNALVTH